MFIVVITACGGGNDRSNTERNSDIVGLWSSEFVRGGETGNKFLIITGSTIDFYEVGNGTIMNEWYSGLDTETSYVFSIDGVEGDYLLDGDELVMMYSDSEINTARITEEESGSEIYSWQIGNGSVGQEERIRYRVTSNQLVLISGSEEEIYIRVN